MQMRGSPHRLFCDPDSPNIWLIPGPGYIDLQGLSMGSMYFKTHPWAAVLGPPRPKPVWLRSIPDHLHNLKGGETLPLENCPEGSVKMDDSPHVYLLSAVVPGFSSYHTS